VPLESTPTECRRQIVGLIADVEKMLRGLGRPYVAVDEAKKALFAGAKLRSFHFVVYFGEGRNWLVLCGERSRVNRDEMDQWGRIFGDGFAAVYAVRRAAGVAFLDAQGNTICTNTVPAANPLTGASAAPAKRLPSGPTVGELVPLDAIIRTDYGTGGRVVNVKSTGEGEEEVWSITYIPHGSKPTKRGIFRDIDHHGINGLVAVDGRILKRDGTSSDEVFIEAAEAAPAPAAEEGGEEEGDELAAAGWALGAVGAGGSQMMLW
jgi:hypothetical protein